MSDRLCHRVRNKTWRKVRPAPLAQPRTACSRAHTNTIRPDNHSQEVFHQRYPFFSSFLSFIPGAFRFNKTYWGRTKEIGEHIDYNNDRLVETAFLLNEGKMRETGKGTLSDVLLPGQWALSLFLSLSISLFSFSLVSLWLEFWVSPLALVCHCVWSCF